MRGSLSVDASAGATKAPHLTTLERSKANLSSERQSPAQVLGMLHPLHGFRLRFVLLCSKDTDVLNLSLL